ncbi:MAG TPA: hypothetical protein VK778_10160 [Solirubrobacteraceae bacterium]|jgi:hypothetical protein|nr:hypothetical protein [Solirubrobacteraceae bacterium]
MAADTGVAPAVAAAPEASAAHVAAPAPKAPDKKAAKAKDPKKDAKGSKKDKGEKGAGVDADGPNIAAHPRAARGVARAKGWGGLIGFVLGGYLSLPTNTLATAGLRALIAGVVCYVAAWAGAVFVWRRLVILELKGREQQVLAPAQPGGGRRELPPARPERPSARSAS